jgi:hypothetical protein
MTCPFQVDQTGLLPGLIGWTPVADPNLPRVGNHENQMQSLNVAIPISVCGVLLCSSPPNAVIDYRNWPGSAGVGFPFAQPHGGEKKMDHQRPPQDGVSNNGGPEDAGNKSTNGRTKTSCSQKAI